MSEPAVLAPARAPLALRRLPLPRWEPPFDDETDDDRSPAFDGEPCRARAAHPATWARPADLALALPLELPVARPPLRLVPPPSAPASRPRAPRVLGPGPVGTGTGPGRPAAGPADDRLPRTPRADLPEARVWAPRFVQVLLEVLAGERPATQVMRHVSLDVYGDLLAVPRAPAGRGRPRSAASLVSLRVTEPDDGVAEVAAVTRRGDRYRALALRLEGQGGRWRCVVVELG